MCIHLARDVERLQGAALVAVRKYGTCFFTDGHKGRTLQPPDI